ncbi:hypothetical protein NM688_g7956 [Phlebia brevispora]|uniref:Uncharacterized protein n=1 Tax=Phlebia brevispora TaxID=194682 RepID=A0ACC1RZD3_9APHY|nr:hypothetical protein NM688_g7956 [Phlebia brevispora]
MAYQQQYHIFSLPKELLDTLIPRHIVNRAPTPPRSPSPINVAATSSSALRSCNVCPGSKFTDVNEQRVHFRSDWHRYNVKMRLNGASVVSEAQFNQLVDGLDDSLSGSASSSSSDDESSDDAISTLVHKTKHIGRPSSPDEEFSSSGPRVPLLWFHSPPSTQLGIYRTIFSTDVQREPTECLAQLKAMQNGGADGRTWTLFMVAGGHFAGAVVRVKRPDVEDEETQSGVTKKGKQKKPKPEVEVLRHKTFHRYTTRRKQGGSQATNDNSKSKAISAGAMLRRYGEQALRDDIRNLITEWAEDIEGSERIFIRASVANRRIFLDYEGAIIQKGDDRLRTFPFQTRRPTQAELNRSP